VPIRASGAVSGADVVAIEVVAIEVVAIEVVAIEVVATDVVAVAGCELRDHTELTDHTM
jgi:hypothetical protein